MDPKGDVGQWRSRGVVPDSGSRVSGSEMIKS